MIIDMLSNQERLLLLNNFNDTVTAYPTEKTISELFQEQVGKTPDHIALQVEVAKLTYRELNEQANQIAVKLQSKGTDSDEIVAVMADRSMETIIAELGIIKAGGAYLPLSPEYPAERIGYLLGDSRAKIVLTKQEYAPLFEEESVEVLIIDQILAERAEAVPAVVGKATDLAYVMYTSGTTGKPKGVMIEHRNVVRLVKNTNYAELETGGRMLQTGELTFDASTFEIWGALLNGMELHLVDKNVILDPSRLEEVLKQREITTAFLTSPLFNQLALQKPEMFRFMKELFIGGDVLPTQQVKRVRQTCPTLQVVHVYGPTESTTFATSFLISQDYESTIPIGKPISNTTAYVVGREGTLCPIGVPGELWIGGDGLARGYLHQEELTATKFVTTSFHGQRVYRTGDMAKWQPDGTLVFIGRVDNQIKIRGYRVEIDEIEKQILQHTQIKEAVVTVLNQGDAGVNLCAYVVAHGNAERTDIKKYLTDHLPNYMVPSFFVYLDRLPLTANGKIDRKALPQPELQMEEYKAPSSQTEQTLASIWSEILGVEKISATASFFDLGGHSLKAISVVSAIRKELGVEISLQELFQKPILKELATVIDGSAKKEFVRIPRAKEAAWYPVSFAQRRMMILNEMEGIHTTYNMPMSLQLEGNVDVVKMGKVFRGLIERHEAFRTTFRYEEGEPVQTIHPEAHFEIEYLTGDQLEVVFSDFVRPFNLAIAPLLRVGVMQEASGKQLLLIDMHHIISDGVSMNLLAEEFDRLYNGEKLPALKIQYKDYAVWQQDEAGSEHYQAQEAYWMERLSGDLPVLELPTDYPRPQVQSFEGAAVSMQIDSELSRRINKLAVKHGATQYMVMLAALNVLLSKYTGQEDIIIGTSVAGRTHSDLSGVMGMFVNSLAMRNQPVGSKTFQEFLEEIKEESLAAFDNQDYPYEALVEKLNVRRDSSRNPIFDVMLNVQNIESSKAQKSGKHGTIIDSKKVNAKFDLKFEIGENDRRISVHVDYATKIYTENTINSLIKHFLKILEEVSDNDQVELCAIEILTDREKNKILYTFNQTNVDFPFEKTVHGFFEEQVKKTPDQIAVICSGEKLTYVELNRKANQLAAVLRNESVLPDQVVGIMTERSMEMIIGILAILKAGGAYLPLDPYAPLERIQYMLEDSKAEILLVQNGALVKGNFNGKTIFLDTEYEEKNVKDTQITSKPNNLAYVIYTSGSTGKPKGVMIEHSSVINRINWMLNKYPLHSNDIILQKTPYTFDVSVWELFMWFFNGNTLCFLAPDAEKDPMKIIETVSSEKVSVIHFVPSMFNLFLEYLDSHKIKGLLSSLKYIFTSGEALSVYTVEKFNDCSNGDFTATLHNLYGPTEATVDVSYYDCASTQSLQTIPIGKPIHNTQLYILNQYQQPVPIGVLGELYISGAGVARGYLNLPELTNERFLPNPFLSQGRMYKTGDLAKWMPNGDIEYAGRVDDQVKIRGYRIELGEIANTVRKINGILEVAIHTISHCGELKICAYVVAQKEMNTQEIKNYLANHLPNYMVPSFFVYLNRLPLTANGKIDRKALPKPDLQIEEAYRSPSSETEQTLAHIWSEILGVEGISATASFFDLGGHSLKAIRMVSAIRKELGVAVSLQELFQKPILEELAATIDGSTKTEYVQIPRAMEAAWYPVSFAQKRMMILNEMEGIQAAYNMPSVLQLQGNIDMLRMEEVFLQLIQRHEAFRTSLNYEKGEPVQVIHSEVPFSIETLVGDQVDAVLREFVRPFNLASAPLLRIGFMTEATGKSLLFIDMHHIISDGISMNLLAEEFDRLYSGIELPALEIQYKDYAVWQHEEAGSKEYQAQEAYWLEQFSDELPILELPTDFPRPQVQSFEGSAVSVQIEPELSVRINELAAKHSATQYMVILAALNVLLAKYTGQEDIVIGTPVAGRTHLEMKNILGLFVNTVAIRSQPQRSKTFQSFLMEIKKNSLNAFHNQSYPYEALVEKLNVPRDPSRNPIFDVLLNVQNMDSNSTEPQGVHYSFYPTELNVSKFDMKILVSEGREGLKLHIEYASKLFSEKTIGNLAKHLITILDVVAKNEDVRLSEIEMLSPNEREQLLYSFNDTVAAYPQDKTIHELFEVQVEQSPTQVAVRGGDDQLTYQELQDRANILASLLRDRGVRPGDQVAILLEPSVEIAVSILGILKTGSSYVPLDPETPEERLQYQLKDSDAQYVVTVRKTMKPGLGETTCLYLDDIDWSKQVLHLEETGQDPEQAAYVIYTSGTTGKPKGVEVTHRNVLNYVSAFIQSAALTTVDKTMLVSSYAFDLGYTALYSSLLSGGELHFVSKEQYADPEQMIGYWHAHGITYIKMTPSLLSMVVKARSEVRKGSQLRLVVVGGESIRANDVAAFLEQYPAAQVMNHYGPTETTIGCITQLIEPSTVEEFVQRPVIGRPIANTQVYIVQGSNTLVPPGVYGELCISGDGVAKGYLGQMALTEERFQVNPYRAESWWYRTGDIARWLPNGTIEFAGRRDHQIKVRGYRVELGEIEEVLLKQAGIRQAAVKSVDHGGDVGLCAYVVGEEAMNETHLREQLLQQLPHYMIPSHVVFLETLPLNSNGKINLQALPDWKAEEDNSYFGPIGETELMLSDIWSDVLDIKEIGRNDNFFLLGGHSLKILTVRSTLSKKGYKVTFNELLTHQTISELAGFLDLKQQTLPGKINTYDDTELLLESRLGVRAKFAIKDYDGRKITVLFMNEIQSSKSLEIEKILSVEVEESLHPEYIIYSDDKYDEDFVPEFISSNQMLLEKKLFEIDYLQERFTAYFSEGSLIKEYPISPSQYYHAQNQEFSGTTIYFNQIVNIDILNEVFAELLQTQEMMKSLLITDQNQLKWQVYEPRTALKIPFYDISMYNEHTKSKILNLVRKHLFNEKYSQENSLMYRLLLVKENTKKFTLMIPFSHVKFDSISRGILEDFISKRYDQLLYKTEATNTSQPTELVSYESYVSQIRRGPQRIQDDRIKSVFDLDNFFELQQGLQKYNVSSFRESSPIILHKGLEFDSNKDGWLTCLNYFIKFVTSFYNMSSIPIWMINFGRQYGSNNYFHLLGECIDFIPLIINKEIQTNQNNQIIRSKLEIAQQHNINFTNLIYNDEMNSMYPASTDVLRSTIYNMPIIFNYLGENASVTSIGETKDTTPLENRNADKMIYQTGYSNGYIFIHLMLSFGEEKARMVFDHL